MEAEPVSDAAPLAVFAAGGKTGTEILRHAVHKGIEVRAFEHTLPEPSDRVDNVEYLQCDVLNDDFSSELEGCRAVISALGVGFSPSTAIYPPSLYTEGTRKLVEAMSTTGMSRIVVISAAFVEPQPSVPAWFELTARSALHNILEQMRAMEDLLERAKGLEWTAARPGWLLDEPYTGEAVIADERLVEGCFRCRHADLAAAMLEFVCENTWINAKPAIARPEEDRFENVSALKAELGID